MSVAQMITVFVIALFAFSLILLVLVSKYRVQKQRAETMRSDHVELQKGITRREVERVVASIRQRRSHCQEDAMAIARQRVYQAYSTAESLYQTFNEKRSRLEIEEMILAALRPVRFDQGHGYYFIVSLDSDMLILTDRPGLLDRHYSTFESKEDKAVFTRLINFIKERQEGVFEYKWTMPGKPGASHHKIAYVKRFEPYNLVIGTGLYLDDVEAETREDLKREISNIKYGANGYFFINDLHGNILAHGDQPELVGASNWEYADSRGNKLFQDLRRVVENPEGGFSYYWWRLPETGEERPKIAFAMAVPEWEWLIGTGLYLDDVDADVEKMQAQLRAESIREVVVILLVTSAIVVVVYILMGVLFRDLRRDVAFFNDCFALAAGKDVFIDEKKIKFVEFVKMAGNANSMLRDKARLLQKLHDDKRQLFVTLQSITDGVIATNQKHEIILLNSVAEAMINCSREEAIGKPVEEALRFFDEYAHAPYACSIQPSLEEACLIALPDHIRLIGESEQKHNVEIVAAPITNQEGEKQGTIIVLRDTTDKRKGERERLRLMKLESVGVLAGGIAHDFNNLLTGLMGNIELAKSCIKPEDEAYLYITDAEHVMHAARGLAMQLLTFAKGGAPIKKIISLKEELAAAAGFSLRGSSIQLETAIADDLLPVEADRGQISQVISNLIINAKQAMPDGGKVILRAENEEEKWVKITLTDQGSGIPEEIREKIFDPYFSTKADGSGLGLASCHSIISNHGGRMMVESELGKGTSFIIRLPVSTKRVSDRPDGGLKKTLERPATRDAKILVVDDMEPLRKMLTRILIKSGHHAEEAGDCDEAVHKYARAIADGTPFDLVITDLTIPGGKGGRDILKSIVMMDPEAQVIVTSGYSDSPVMARYQEYGFAACLTKPYSIADVREIVQDILQKNKRPETRSQRMM
ncbi:MAG: cache domain-containing protein [Lentisphaeria bacterium]|nr:cache domain-containing protein [Lentisphaeria bacterium]